MCSSDLREQGIIVRPGVRVRGVGDLARPGLRWQFGRALGGAVWGQGFFRAHLSFSVDRPTRHSIMVMIQNRITTWVSFQPSFSK